MRTVRITFLTSIVALSVLTQSLAIERIDFRVNDDGGLAQQTYPRIAVGTDRTFVIAWADKRLGNSDIFMQRFDPLGEPLGFNRRVNDDNVQAWQTQPALATTLAGRHWVVWKDYRNGAYPFGDDIFFQQLESDATPTGTNQELTLEQPDSLKASPDIAVAPDGSVIVVWADYRNFNWDIFGQRLDADGQPVDNNVQINDATNTAQQHAPRIAYSTEGWFVVTWYDNRRGHDDVYAKVFDSQGQPQTADILVNSDSESDRQAYPDVATDARGNFTVVWVDWRNGSYPLNPDIFSRLFTGEGMPVTTDTRLNSDGTLRAQREPTIAADRQGNVAIIWSDSVAGSFDIMGQMIDAQGTVRESNFRANELADSLQVQADVALDGQYRYIAWVDGRNGNLDIYASISQYNDPSLIALPDAALFEKQENGPNPAPLTITIDHVGYNPLPFLIVSSATWLDVQSSTGTTPADVTLSVQDPGLPPGNHTATLTVIDTYHGDSSLIIPVNLTVTSEKIVVTTDTVSVGSASVALGSEGLLAIELITSRDLKSSTIPLGFDPEFIHVDSLSAGSQLPEGLSADSRVDTAGGIATLTLTAQPSQPMPPGTYTVGFLHFTGRTTSTRKIIDTTDGGAILVDVESNHLVPVVLPGEIAVGMSTGREEPEGLSLPGDVILQQNYPNPFNPQTTISFELSTARQVDLRVYNILGQEISVLIDQRLPAGAYEAVWNAADAASGPYIYRLRTSERQIARKMLLVR